MTESTTRQFELSEFDRALALLEGEQKAMELSRAQRILYRMYTVFLWGFVASLVGVLVALISAKQDEFGTVDKIGISLVILGAVCVAVSLVTALLNLPLLWKRLVQQRRIQRLGLAATSQLLWRSHWEHRTRARVINWGALIIGAAFVLTALVCLIGPAKSVGLALLVIGFPLLLLPVLRNSRAWLDVMAHRGNDIRQLRESMLNLRGDAGGDSAQHVTLPAQTVDKLARIETEQIARSRAEALAESGKPRMAAFAVLSSQPVIELKRTLPYDERWKVEETLDALMLEPRPASAVALPDSGLLRQDVAGTDMELVYQVEDAGRQLKVIELRRSAAGGARG